MKSISKSEAVKNLVVDRIRSGQYNYDGVLPSIEELAKSLEVSKNTVSLALAGLREAGIITLEHGKATRVTGKLFQKHIEIISFGLFPIEHDAFWGEFSRGIEAELRRQSAITFHHSHLTESFLFNGETPPEHILCGGVLLMGTSKEEYVRQLKRHKIPFALVYEYSDVPNVPSFHVDYLASLEQVADRFVAAGRRRIAYVGSINSSHAGEHGANRRKRDIFQEVMLRHGLLLRPELTIHCEHFMHSGYESTVKLLSDPARRPDAIFYASDLLAPGGYKAIHEAGLNVPGDILAVGCDKLEIGDYIVPPLSTVAFDRFEIGRAAAVGLVGHLLERRPLLSRIFPAELIQRESLHFQ